MTSLLVIMGGEVVSPFVGPEKYGQVVLPAAEEHLEKWEHTNEYEERNALKPNSTV